jgi:hypothetical protein
VSLAFAYQLDARLRRRPQRAGEGSAYRPGWYAEWPAWCELAECLKITRQASMVPECIVVLVTFNFRYLASAPKVRWRARAGAWLQRRGSERWS